MYEISKNTIGVYPNFKIRKLVICVTSSHFPPWENMSFPCQLSSTSVIVSSHIYEGWHLICFVFSHLLPKCPGREISPASAMTFPKYPRGREMNECCKMLLQRPFLQLARIQWHLVVIVDTFKDGRYFYLPPFSFVLLWTKNICNLPYMNSEVLPYWLPCQIYYQH